ncbi:transglycosylase SLT domain-containing protein [Streptomyces purpurogeneiscleroticus]|uniref:transglycosylase SLT domain-containing protein n=1 Tax=Streptomyces purpurogeneiscleroticus TaxID=68259 RepID=UPI001CBD329C|nr:transglycosylase SLT domain-containing protein [Streptomyces purpurogeneiscleroticus]MBZ4015783.1 lytic transglycosylase [Streptomyces purpurogeneiscleroticus]
MPLHAKTGYSRLNRNHKLSAAAVAAGGAAAVVFAVVPGAANAEPTQSTTAQNVKPVAYHVVDDSSAYSLVDNAAAKARNAELTEHSTRAAEQASASAFAAKKQAEGDARAAAQAKAKAAAEAAAQAKEAAKNKAAQQRTAQAASRSAERQPVTYPNNLDGWIRESLSIMKKHGIPGSYEGIKRNIIRESGGNPRAINNWDVNAQNGIPSKGLLQVIQPTFDQYHVEGTANDLYDPVANIVAACNYAADRYGSMDNVDSAY